jgi:hypothetical protein
VRIIPVIRFPGNDPGNSNKDAARQLWRCTLRSNLFGAASIQKSRSMNIGFVSMPYSGHLNPMIALARKLEARGHDIVFFGIEDAAATVQAANLKFHAVAQKEFPLGGSAGYLEKISKLRGLEILRFSTQTRHPKLCRAMLNHLPDAVTLRAGLQFCTSIVTQWVRLGGKAD